MKITYDTQTQSGEINGKNISQKPTFNFDYEWFLLTDNVAYKLLSYGGMNENEPMSEEEKQEVISWANSYEFPAPPPPKELSLDELKLKKINELNSYVDLRLHTFLANYPAVEQKSFPDKKEEALRVKKDESLSLEEAVAYLGFGPAAHSYDGHNRSFNIASIKKYNEILEGKRHFEVEELTALEREHEYIMTRLRTMWGINLREMEALFSKDRVQKLLSLSERFIQKGLLFIDEGHLKLSSDGIFISDNILVELFD